MMRRVALMLSVVGILFVAAAAAEAHGWHHGPRYGHFYAHGGPAVLKGRVLMGPTMFVPPAPRYYYRPAPCYQYRCFAPAPRYNFYYRGRGLSFGIGF